MNMNPRNPDELITEVKEEQQTRGELATEALQWFLDDNRIGELYPRGEVVQALSEYLEVDNRKASIALSSVVGDIVDPVQQIVTQGRKFVGVIEYNVYEDSGAYGYIHYDDRLGKRKRVVCAKCVEEQNLDENIKHAEQGRGSSHEDATWKQLLNKVTAHYADAHNEAPEDIEPGASLVSGTTISGNTVFHAGNESDIDHNSLSNRTHSGDSITPDSVSTDETQTGRISFGSPVTKFISLGIVNYGKDGFIELESGLSNELTNIQNGVHGDVLILKSAGGTITLVANESQTREGMFLLEGGTDKELQDNDSRIILQYDETSADGVWVQLSIST